MTIALLSQIRDRLQLDRPLAFALATRVWQAISGPITIVLLIKGLSRAETGVYYSIIAIVGIQAYFELGLLNVLVSHSGHEAAAMKQAAEDDRDGSARDTQWLHAAARMRDLISAAFKWFGAASLLFILTAIALGMYTFADSNVDWRGPLIAIIPIAAVSVWLAPAISILEGAGFRDLIYRFRFIQIVAGSLVVWTALLVGLGLWSLVLSSLVQSIMAVYITFVAKSDFFQEFRHIDSKPPDFSWTRDVVPVQWRVALIGAAFHFATQFFTVIIVMFHSDAESAPVGMTLSVTTAIQMLALAWVQTKYPVVSAHHGAGDRETAGTIWRRTAIVSTCLLVAAFVALSLGVASLPWFNRGLEQRFLLPWQVMVLGVGCFSNHIAALQGFYVLSRRAKPLLAASLIGAIATGAAVWIGGYLYSTDGVIIGYTLGMTLVLLPLHSWAYYHFRLRSDVSV